MARHSRVISRFGRLHPVAAAAMMTLLAGAAHSAPVNWVGPNHSFWDLAVNWSAGLPGLATDDVGLGAFDTELRSGTFNIRSLVGTGRLTLSGGMLGLTQASSLGSLTMSGGILAGVGALTVTGMSSWSGGTMDGAGSTAFNGALALSGNGQRIVTGRSLSFAGTTTWTNSSVNGGLIYTGSGATLTNSGTLIQNGSAAAATLALPNSRIGLGGSSETFVINNVGTGGPSLRGAIQTTGISSAGLSGSGVTAQNWGPVAQGASSGSYTVTFAPTVGGALSGQMLQVVNNFDNVTGQSLTITGAAYNLAQASAAAPNPVSIANQRVGGTGTQALTVSNMAPANSFSEGLNGSIAGSADITASGSFKLLVAGASSTALLVGLETTSAGAKTGTATLTLASDGAGSSGFAALAMPSQTIAVSGNVFRLATPRVDTTPVGVVSENGSQSTLSPAQQP